VRRADYCRPLSRATTPKAVEGDDSTTYPAKPCSDEQYVYCAGLDGVAGHPLLRGAVARTD
jgi:hypothetical protein